MAGIIFYGSNADTEGQALAEAQRHLATDNLDNDICYMRYRNKVTMDDIRELLTRLDLKSDGYAVWFDRADELSSNCQNALLKALEDREDVLFIFFAESRLLATVESRCEIRQAKKFSIFEFKKYYSGTDEAYFYFSLGSEECLARILQDSKIQEIIIKISTDVFGFLDEPKEVLETFGMLKEKGNSFFDTHKEYVLNLYACFESLLLTRHMDDARTLKILTVIEEHKELFRKSNSYGKNDFFDFLVGICETE